VVAALVEGNSINAVVRLTGVAKHTVLNLLRELGCASADYHHKHVRNLRVRRLQCDETRAFVGAKKKNEPKTIYAIYWADAASSRETSTRGTLAVIRVPLPGAETIANWPWAR
jgi:hypothetical protein